MNKISMTMPERFTVEEAAIFRQKAYELISGGERNFELDFSRCTFIDSTGLGVLVSVYKKCVELGGGLKLHSVNNQQVLRVFKLTRLDKVFFI